MPETIEQLRRERDEAHAAVAALREALESSQEVFANICKGDFNRQFERMITSVEKRINAALSQPNPGAALLERLKAAEAVCVASEAHIRCAWSGDESRVGLVSFGAYRGKNEAADSEFARTDKIDETRATATSALAAWRKLTGDPQ